MTPLLLLTIVVFVVAAVLTRHRTLAWALSISGLTLLIVLSAAALQLSLKFPGRPFLTYLDRTPPLVSLSALATLAVPSLLALTLASLPVGLLLIRRPLPSREVTWAADIAAALTALFVLLWLLFEPLQTLQPNLRSSLKLVPLLGTLLQSPWLAWIMLAALGVRGIAGRPREESPAPPRDGWSLWAALALLTMTWVAAGLLRPS